MNVDDQISLKRTFWTNRKKVQTGNSHLLSLIQLQLYETV